jgi:hypothetical protein
MKRLLFALCTLALAAQAQQDTSGKTGSGSGAPQGGMPKPDPALTKAFGDSVGTWHCKGKMMLPKEMGGAEIATRSSMTIKKELNGFAYTGEWKSEKTKEFPAMSGKMTWAYDAGAGKLMEFSVSSTGDVMHGTADASDGEKVVWNEEGTMMGKPSKTRTTVTMKGKNGLELAFDAQGEGGTWAPMGKDNCTKG